MATMLKTSRFLARASCLAVLFAIVCTMGSAQRPQSAPITITLAGQSMIRSDIRATAPAVGPRVQGLRKGGWAVHNLETPLARKEKGGPVGGGLSPPPLDLPSLTTSAL